MSNKEKVALSYVITGLIVALAATVFYKEDIDDVTQSAAVQTLDGCYLDKIVDVCMCHKKPYGYTWAPHRACSLWSDHLKGVKHVH